MGIVHPVATVSSVDGGHILVLASQDRHLFQRCLQGVAIVRVARKAAHADHQALVQRRGQVDLAAEFMSRTRALPFGRSPAATFAQ